jgi:hypothetical protein
MAWDFDYDHEWHKKNALPGTALEKPTNLTSFEIEMIDKYWQSRDIKRENWWPIPPGSKIKNSSLVVDFCLECDTQIRVSDVSQYNLCDTCACRNNHYWSNSTPQDEVSPWQENAIRILEDFGDYLTI